MNKKGFLLYATQWAALQQMNDSELGGAIRELCGYAFDGITPERPSVSFMFLKAQIDIDEQKYQEKCEKNRANVSKRWNTENMTEYDRIRPNTKRTNKEDKENKDENKDENKYIEKKNIQEKAEQSSSSKFSFKVSLVKDYGVDEQVAADYMAVRNKHKAPSTLTAFNGFIREAEKVQQQTGMTLTDIVRICAERGWQGLKAEWILKDQERPTVQEGQEDLDAMAKQWRQQLAEMRAADGRQPGQFKDL